MPLCLLFPETSNFQVQLGEGGPFAGAQPGSGPRGLPRPGAKHAPTGAQAVKRSMERDEQRPSCPGAVETMRWQSMIRRKVHDPVIRERGCNILKGAGLSREEAMAPTQIARLELSPRPGLRPRPYFRTAFQDSDRSWQAQPQGHRTSSKMTGLMGRVPARRRIFGPQRVIISG